MPALAEQVALIEQAEREKKKVLDNITAHAKEPVILSGRAGGAFSIYGEGFGPSGELHIAGKHIVTTRWDDQNVRGELPEGIAGPIVLKTLVGERHGVFPSVKSAVVAPAKP